MQTWTLHHATTPDYSLFRIILTAALGRWAIIFCCHLRIVGPSLSARGGSCQKVRCKFFVGYRYTLRGWTITLLVYIKHSASSLSTIPYSLLRIIIMDNIRGAGELIVPALLLAVDVHSSAAIVSLAAGGLSRCLSISNTPLRPNSLFPIHSMNSFWWPA